MGELGKALASVGAAAKAAQTSALGAVGYPTELLATGKGGGSPTSTMPTLAPAGSLLAPTPEMATAQGVDQSQPGQYALGQNLQNGPLAPLPEAPSAEEDREPFDNPYTPTDDQDIVVEGDSWKPKGPGILGDIMDTLLMLKGRPPVFRIKKNMPEILQGFAAGGEARNEAISRMRQVHGQTAWEMAKDDAQMDAADALAQQRQLEIKLKAAEYTGSIIHAFADNPEGYERVLPTARGLVERLGGDPELLPEKYDKDRIELAIGSALKPYPRERLEDFDIKEQRQAEHQRAQRESLEAHYSATREEKRRANQADEALAREKFILQEKRGDKGSKTIFSLDRRDDKGRPMPAGSLSSDGRKLMLRGEDGQLYVYKLRKVGDITSRVVDHAATEELRKKMEEE